MRRWYVGICAEVKREDHRYALWHSIYGKTEMERERKHVLKTTSPSDVLQYLPVIPILYERQLWQVQYTAHTPLCECMWTHPYMYSPSPVVGQQLLVNVLLTMLVEQLVVQPMV